MSFVKDLLIIRVRMYGCHHSLNDPKIIMQNLDERRNAVGCT